MKSTCFLKTRENHVYETFRWILHLWWWWWYPFFDEMMYTYFRLKPLFKSPHYRHYARTPTDVLCLPFNKMTILNNIMALQNNLLQGIQIVDKLIRLLKIEEHTYTFFDLTHKCWYNVETNFLTKTLYLVQF